MSAATGHHKQRLLGQQQALEVYMDSLLKIESEEIQLPSRAPEPAGPDRETHAVNTDSADLALSADIKDGNAVCAERGVIVPDWARRPFQCVVFSVAGLKLALPMSALQCSLDWSDSIRPVAAPHPWYLGVFSYQGNDVKVIDLGCFVLPDTQCAQLQDVNGRLEKIAVLKGSQWALACGKVLGVITVSGDDLLWRTRHGKRPWLAGTSTKHKFGLLDSAAMVTLFASGRRQ